MEPTNSEGPRLLALATAGRRFASVTTLDRLYPLAAELACDVLAATSVSISHHDAEQSRWPEPTRSGGPDAEQTCSISLPVIVGSAVWGEIRATRRAGLPPFDEPARAAGEAFSTLFAAALAHIADREELHSLAYRDGLTGLGNRRMIDERLEELFQSPVLSEPVGVILCDVDRLKQVNDLHGHLAGDGLLCEVGSLLSQVAAMFPTSIAARLGGDEFCLLVEGADAERLRTATDQLMSRASRLPLSAGLSCGWAVTDKRPGGATSAAVAARALMRLADAAQYRAKRAGRGPRSTEDLGDDAALDAGTLGAELVDQVAARLSEAGEDVRERLIAVAVTCTRALTASAWSVSVSVDGGPVTIVDHDDAERRGFADTHPLQPGVGFSLDDYPATARALKGGSFHATIDLGEESERQFLAANGYDEIIGAGAPEDGSRSWLVEIVGDALSLPLAPYQGLLRALVELALRRSLPVSELASPGSAASAR